MTNKFNVILASNTDKENIVYEIYYGTDQFAEISNENGEQLRIEIYPPVSTKYWDFYLKELNKILQDAEINLGF